MLLQKNSSNPYVSLLSEFEHSSNSLGGGLHRDSPDHSLHGSAELLCIRATRLVNGTRHPDF